MSRSMDCQLDGTSFAEVSVGTPKLNNRQEDISPLWKDS